MDAWRSRPGRWRTVALVGAIGAMSVASADPGHEVIPTNAVSPVSVPGDGGPGPVASPYARGMAIFEAGDLSGAIPLFREAVAFEAGSSRSLRALGYALALSGDLDAAERTWHRLASMTPEDPVALQALATVRALRGDAEGARRMFARLVVVDEDNGEGWAGLGRVLLELGDVDQGIAALEQARRLGVGGAAVERPLAEAYRRAGRTDASRPPDGRR